MPEQRAFSPEEVATMLGLEQATVRSLLDRGKLGSKKIRDAHRIFLSDLEDYLGEDRARSLVRDLGGDELKDDGKKMSPYEPVAKKWSEIGEGKAIVLSGLSWVEVQDLRDFLYHRFGKKNILVRPAKQKGGRWEKNEERSWSWRENETFKVLVQAREGGEYLRD
jgi:excisionase family DNA binding protein